MAGLAENDTVSTIGEDGKRVWLYPTWAPGRLLRMRTVVHAILVAVLLIGPWIDVGGHPAIRIDIPARRIYFWGLQLFATDGSYLLFLCGFVLFGVLFFTALFGRAWCGWTCPQTVFLESVIRPIERLIEGSPAKQRKLDRAPWTANKIFRKGLKYAAFLVVCGAIGTTFVAYFLGREGVMEAQADPLSHPVGTFVFVFITGLTLFDFAWFREQTCLVVCPYGRFQSVLLDQNSIGVNYDEARGEPRGKKGTEGAGDCVDCKKCTVVCPTGIDIRKGVQMECIQCMACVDACNSIMNKLHRPEGLIRLTSLNAVEGKKTKWLRPRVLAYGAALGVVSVALGLTLFARESVELHLGRQPGAAWAQLPDGRVQNAMRVRISNKSDVNKSFTIDLVEPADAEIVTPITDFDVDAGTVEHMPVFVIRPAESSADGADIVLQISDGNGFSDTVDAEFLAQPRNM